MAPEHETNERTWADDIEADLPPILAMLEATGATGLDDDTCAYALVLAGRARQLSRPGDGLEALAIRVMPHVAALLARAPLVDPGEVLDRADSALTGEDDGLDDPLDALLDGDDWLTTHGLAAQAQLAVAHDPVAFGEHFGALVSACPDRVVELRAFADARVSAMEARAHEAPAWEALLDIWSAVVEAAAMALVESLPVSAQGVSATVEAMANAVFSKFPVWAQMAEEEVGASVPVFIIRRFKPSAYADGGGLPEVDDPVEIAVWGRCQIVLTSGQPDEPGGTLIIEGHEKDALIAAERDGENVEFRPGRFDSRIADATAGRYRVTIGDRKFEFILRPSDQAP